jgi:glycosyltransferase involved in cell wall biosynthesis
MTRASPYLPKARAKTSIVAVDRPDIAIRLFERGYGGLDRVAMLLASGFAERGLAVELWLTRNEGPIQDLLSDAVNVRKLPQRHSARGVALALQMPALRRLVRTVRPRVLLSAGNQSNLNVALACLGSKTASVGKITNPVDRPQSKGLALAFRKWRFAREAKLARLMLVLSQADLFHYRDWFGEAALAFVHNPYVTAEMLAIGRGRLDGTKTIAKFLSIGRLSAQKDHATLLQALGGMKERRWHLTLAGEGPLRAELEQQAESLGISARIDFVGFADALPLYAEADLMILSSRWEGLPAVALEAMACGCDIVSTDCSRGLSGLLNGLGLTPPTPVGDADALRSAICAAVDRNTDRSKLLAAAEAFGIDNAVDDHLRLFAPFLSGD